MPNLERAVCGQTWDKRLRAEQRLLSEVRRQGSACADSARRSARLCAALSEAKRLGCHQLLLVKATALLAILERAAAEDHERKQLGVGSTFYNSPKSARRDALIQRLALDWQSSYNDTYIYIYVSLYGL